MRGDGRGRGGEGKGSGVEVSLVSDQHVRII